MKNKFLWIIAAILLIIAGWYYASRRTSITMPMEEFNKQDDKEPISITAPMIVSENAILAENQTPGISAKINFASFPEGGYIVIHEEKNGAPGLILGSVSHLLPGESKDLEVMLSRKSVDKENLFAMLHKDNGDGVFKASDDSPIKDDEGNIVMMKFTIEEMAGKENNK